MFIRSWDDDKDVIDSTRDIDDVLNVFTLGIHDDFLEVSLRLNEK